MIFIFKNGHRTNVVKEGLCDFAIIAAVIEAVLNCFYRQIWSIVLTYNHI